MTVKEKPTKKEGWKKAVLTGIATSVIAFSPVLRPDANAGSFDIDPAKIAEVVNSKLPEAARDILGAFREYDLKTLEEKMRELGFNRFEVSAVFKGKWRGGPYLYGTRPDTRMVNLEVIAYGGDTPITINNGPDPIPVQGAEWKAVISLEELVGDDAVKYLRDQLDKEYIAA